MTWLGSIFWGTCIIVISVGFFMQRKYGTGSPEKKIKQTTNEEIARNTHNNDRPRF